MKRVTLALATLLLALAVVPAADARVVQSAVKNPISDGFELGG